MVERLAQVTLVTGNNSARFQDNADTVGRLLCGKGVDRSTINLLSGVLASVADAEETEVGREFRANTGLLGRANNMGVQIILTAVDPNRGVPLDVIKLLTSKASP